MKFEPKKIGGNLPREELDWLPTEPPIDEKPFSDSTSELARGLDVVEIPVDDPRSTLADPSNFGAWQPMTADEKMARELGLRARRDGSLPNASPFDPGTVLDLCWIDGYRAGV
jgi:hypothetical protein